MLILPSPVFYICLMVIIHPLVQKVLSALESSIGTVKPHFLLACSGGADSTALLLVFCQIHIMLSCTVSVITVNHNIRSSAESAADADFVAALCKRLNIPCVVEELPRGSVSLCAKQRGRGVEDAARALRYGIFEKTADSIGADFIVTAHNENDSYETALMRLFQGGGTAGLRTMPLRRGRYLRPLICVDRSCIEDFLRQQDIPWCEDSTNAENTYLRNRIRHFLVPALNSTFGSWHSGLLKTFDRIALDCSFCDTALKNARQSFGCGSSWCFCKHGALQLSSAFFYSQHPALRLRILEEGCRLLNIGERIPFGILSRMTEDSPQTKVIAAGKLRLEVREACLVLFDADIYRSFYMQKCYGLTLSSPGFYDYPLGKLEVYRAGTGFYIRDTGDGGAGIGPVALPVCVRSRRSGDRIRMKTGGCKEIKKILNEWAADSLARELLPIIIENNCIRALYGSPLGYKNWFVEE